MTSLPTKTAGILEAARIQPEIQIGTKAKVMVVGEVKAVLGMRERRSFGEGKSRPGGSPRSRSRGLDALIDIIDF